MNIQIRHIIFKLTSVCNLSCRYCFVFNKNDHSYLDEPVLFSLDNMKILLKRIDEYCKKRRIQNFMLTFHGGEPLMAGIDFYKTFIALSKEYIKSTKLHLSMQTNGTLLNEEWCIFFRDNNIGLVISIDGNRRLNANRIYKNGKEAFNKIIKGYKIANEILPSIGVQSVINTTSSPSEYYSFFKDLKPKYLYILLQDMNYETIDSNILGVDKWLCNLFDLWYFDEDKDKPCLCTFEYIINLILGEKDTGGEMFGRGFNGAIDVRSDGTIDVVDTLRISDIPLLKEHYSLLDNCIEDIERETIFQHFYFAHQDEYLNNKCRQCIIKEICGGGLLLYRYSKENAFDNTQVYCHPIFNLITHIQNRIIDRIEFTSKIKVDMDRLKTTDFSAW